MELTHAVDMKVDAEVAKIKEEVSHSSQLNKNAFQPTGCCSLTETLFWNPGKTRCVTGPGTGLGGGGCGTPNPEGRVG